MEIKVSGDAKELSDFITAIQNRKVPENPERNVNLDPETLYATIRDMRTAISEKEKSSRQ